MGKISPKKLGQEFSYYIITCYNDIDGNRGSPVYIKSRLEPITGGGPIA